LMDHAAVVRAAMMWCAELLEAALEEPGDPEAREVFLADATGLRDRQEVVFVTAVRKFTAGLAVGRSDLNRNGYAWMARNVATLIRLTKDEPNWLRGYRAALEDAQDGEVL